MLLLIKVTANASRRTAGYHLSFEPGSDYEYHIGYPVLGVVIETVTGKTLEEFYQERIFRPLGMKRHFLHLE